MAAAMREFERLNEEIETYRLKALSVEDINRGIELCKRGMDQLSEVFYQIENIPRSIPCRDALIQFYAMMDQFKKARTVVENAFAAGAYHPTTKAAVLKRIDEMEKARNRLVLCISENPGIEENQVEKRLKCDKKALKWYLANSTLIKKNTYKNTYALWLSEEITLEIDRGIKAAIVDVETTGLSKVKDEIVEIGVMFCRFDTISGEIMEIIEEINELNEPSFPIPAAVTRIHGITDKKVDGKRINKKKLDQIFAEADIIIAHNASFDSGFIQRYFPASKVVPWHCSVNDIHWKSYGFSTRKLLDLCRHHRITQHQTHRALDDVKLTVELLQQRNPAGEYYLKELLHKSKQPSY
ncbi:exonuclease domain-containing protein [Alteribacillus bidgolensis]|uniref:Exonuclease n=1 Tax=Alteribacillus bidgolensis TaxID=930129 RepID=A0A1G8Q1I3_9BACI|nr:exonuclease domain-containing protein [Alteribacillus bidgolensis]SDI98581.1 Exonuclease [Alteribacillus bidgolensis]